MNASAGVRTDRPCPNCAHPMRGDVVIDQRTGTRGYRCPGCDLGWTPRDLRAYERGVRA